MNYTDLRIENEYLILPEGLKNKKISATNFYGLIGLNKFKPKGDYLLQMLGIVKEDFDTFYTKRGEIGEHLLNNWLQSKGYETKTWNKFEINFDNFPTHKELGGMIDIAITKPERIVVECKTKNIKDIEKIKAYPNFEQEYQARFYGFMSKCNKVKIIYVFFNDEQEQNIRLGLPIDYDLNNYEFYEKDLTWNFEDMEKKLSDAVNYKNQCLNDRRIPLKDISEKTLIIIQNIIDKNIQQQ